MGHGSAPPPQIRDFDVAALSGLNCALGLRNQMKTQLALPPGPDKSRAASWISCAAASNSTLTSSFALLQISTSSLLSSSAILFP